MEQATIEYILKNFRKLKSVGLYSTDLLNQRIIECLLDRTLLPQIDAFSTYARSDEQESTVIARLLGKKSTPPVAPYTKGYHFFNVRNSYSFLPFKSFS